LSEKRSNIAQKKIALAELKEKDFQYRAASLEQMLALYQQRLALLEHRSKQIESENKSIREDRDRVSLKLHDTMNIVTESINHVESLEAKVEEKEVSLKLTQQLFSKASEDVKAAKATVRAMQESISSAETELTVTKVNHAAEVEKLRNELSIAQHENKSLTVSIKALELSAAQHVEELTNKLSDLESAKALEVTNLEESLSHTKSKVTHLENSLESEILNSEQLQAEVDQLQEDITKLKSELASNQEGKEKFITDLQVVTTKADSLEEALEAEKANVEQLQNIVFGLENENKKLRSEIESNIEDLNLCQEVIAEKDEAISELQSMVAYNDEELNNISAMFEEYKSMNEENILRSLNKQEEELESKEQQLQELCATLEKQREYMSDVEELQKKQTEELEKTRDSVHAKDAKLSNLQQELNDSRLLLEQSATRQQDLKDEILNLCQATEDMTITIYSLKQKASQEAELCELTAAKDKAEKELLEKEKIYEHLLDEKQRIEKDMISRSLAFDREVKDKEDYIQRLINDKEILEKDLLSSKSSLEEAVGAKEGLYQQLEIQKEALSQDLLTRISTLEGSLLLKEDQVQLISNEKEHFKKEFYAMNSNFQLLVSQKEALENDITMTKSMLDVARNELHLKSATMDDMHEALSENFKTISSLRVDLDRTRLQLSLAERSIEKVKSEFTESLNADPRIIAMQSSLDDAHGLIVEKNQQIQKLEVELKKVLADNDILTRLNSHQDVTGHADYDVSIMKEELTKIKQNISILRNERVALEESLVVLRSSLEEKSLEVEAFNVKFGCNDSSNVGERSEGLTNVPHENSSNEILKSSLVETCALLSMKTSQLSQLDKELEKARRIQMLLEKEVVQRDKQSTSPQEDVEQLSQAEVIQSEGSENKLWYKEDQAPQIINLESKIASLEKNVAELQMMLDIASSKYEANKDYIEDLEVSLAAATKINEEFVEKRLGMLLSKIESAENLAHERELLLEEAKCNHASIVEKLEESLTAANAVNEELKNDLSIIQEERDSTALKIESYKSTLGELEQKLNNELAKHEETKEELVRANSVREGSSLYANREIQKLKKKLKEVESSRDKMKKTAETMVQRYSLLEQSLSEVEKDLHAKTEELEGWKEEAERISAEKEDLEKYLENLKSKVESVAPLNKNDALLHHCIDNLIKCFQKKEKEVAKLSSSLEQREIDLVDLVRSSKDDADTIKSLEALIQGRDEELKYLNGSLVYLQKQMNAIAKKYEHCASTLEEFKIHAKELNLENSELNHELCMLKKNMGKKTPEEARSKTPCNRLTNYAKSSLLEKAQDFNPRTPSRTQAEKIPDTKSSSRSSRSEIWQESGVSIPNKTAVVDSDDSPLSQARKNWEAIKREKAGDQAKTFFASTTRVSNALNLQDDEYVLSRKGNSQSNTISP
jgi:chromosome segregation ATPase